MHESKIAEIEKMLSDPETYRDEELVKDLVYKDRDLREKLETLYEELDGMIPDTPPSESP